MSVVVKQVICDGGRTGCASEEVACVGMARADVVTGVRWRPAVAVLMVRCWAYSRKHNTVRLVKEVGLS